MEFGDEERRGELRLERESTFERTAKRVVAQRLGEILKEFVGRGPRFARAYLNEQLLLVVFEDTLTKAERALAEENREEMVRELRRSWEIALETRMRKVVEEETGRAVIAVLGDQAVLPDFAMRCFLLGPAPARAEASAADSEEEIVAAASTEGSDAHRLVSIASEPSGTGAEGETVRAISREMVSLFKEYLGRGPEKARSYLEDDLIVVLLSNTLTRGEKAVAEDRQQLIGEIRRQFQGALEDRAIEIVERLSGRNVVAFLSGNSLEPDYAVELFVLEGGELSESGGSGKAPESPV